jgi:hypothetical protein
VRREVVELLNYSGTKTRENILYEASIMDTVELLYAFPWWPQLNPYIDVDLIFIESLHNSAIKHH